FFFFFFFFSSRRRHTRSKRDWSSDVCSSDLRTLRFVVALVSAPGTVAQARATASGLVSGGQAVSPEVIAWVQVRRAWPMETRARSEERRVGKECRGREAP